MPGIENMTEAESFKRGVFAFTHGGVRVIRDPLKVLNKMYEVEPGFDDLVARFFAVPDPEADEATKARAGVAMVAAATALEPVILAGFRLDPLTDDGSGISTTEALNLLADFLNWQDRREAYREAEALRPASPPEAETGPPMNHVA